MSYTIPITTGRQIALLAIVSVGSALTLLLVCLRYIGRWKRQGKLGYSDLWIGIAEVCLLVFHALITVKVVKGGSGLQQQDVIDRWGQQPIWLLYKLTYSSLAIIVPTFCLGKMSVLALYVQLMPFKEMILLVRVAATVSVLGSFAIILSNFFLCSPVSHFWDSWDDTAPGGHCGSLIDSYFWTGLINSISDTFVILVPMPWLYKLRVPLKQKLFVVTLFSLGIFIIGITATRLWYCTTLRGSGAIIYNYTYTGFWNTALCSLEGTATITVACVPFLQPACFGPRSPNPPLAASAEAGTAEAEAEAEVEAPGLDEQSRGRPKLLGRGLARLQRWLGLRRPAYRLAEMSRGWSHKRESTRPGSLATTTADAPQDLEHGATFITTASLGQGPRPWDASAAVVEDKGIIALRDCQPRGGKDSEDGTETIPNQGRYIP